MENNKTHFQKAFILYYGNIMRLLKCSRNAEHNDFFMASANIFALVYQHLYNLILVVLVVRNT